MEYKTTSDKTTQTEVKMTWMLKTANLKQVDAMMKKMLKILTSEELEIITDCKITKTLLEVDIDANMVNQPQDDK